MTRYKGFNDIIMIYWMCNISIRNYRFDYDNYLIWVLLCVQVKNTPSQSINCNHFLPFSCIFLVLFICLSHISSKNTKCYLLSATKLRGLVAFLTFWWVIWKNKQTKKTKKQPNNIIIPGSRKFYWEFFTIFSLLYTKPLINSILNTQVKYNVVI